jgi:fimbrial chaperone protein
MRPPGALVVAAAALAAQQVFAGSLEVAPTTVELTPDAKAAVFYVTNRGDQPIVAQIQGFDWSQGPGGEKLTTSQALTISPPMARLTPGQRQVVRLAASPDASASAERSFRLLVSELPDPSQPPAKGVRVLLQFSVPVFAASETGRAHLNWDLARDGGSLELIARNDGDTHAKLLAPTIETSDGRHISATPNGLAYILPGASHRWIVPLRDVKPGEALHIEGRDEASGAMLDAALAVPR